MITLEAKTITALARIFSGTALLITSMITGIDSNIQMISMLLLGLPFEALQSGQKE